MTIILTDQEVSEDFADPKCKGNLSVEINEVDWFMALFEYYTQEKGMSEDEVMELFKCIAKTGAPVNLRAPHRARRAAS